MSGYQIAHLGDIEEVDDGREPMTPIRHHFGITAFGINGWTAREAGDRLINEHDESYDQQEELYIVQSGHARFELDGESQDAPVGTLVYVRPGVKRTAFAEEAGTTLVAIGGVPGKAYEVGGWEIWGPLDRLYQAGDYEAVIEQGRELIEANPQYPLALYNLACCESLTGRSEDAIGHLRQAIAGRERLREYAKEDTDLDAVREEPAFKQLVGA